MTTDHNNNFPVFINAEENNPIPSYYRIVTFYMYAMVEKDDCLSGFITFELIEELHEAVYYYINRCLDVQGHYLYCFHPRIVAAAIIAAARLSVNLYAWTDKLENFTGLTQKPNMGCHTYGEGYKYRMCDLWRKSRNIDFVSARFFISKI